MTITDPSWLQKLQQRLSNADFDLKFLSESAEQLRRLAEHWHCESKTCFSRGAELLASLIDLAVDASSDGLDIDRFADQLLTFVADNLDSLNLQADDGLSFEEQERSIEQFIEQAESKWREYLSVLEGASGRPEHDFDCWDGDDSQNDVESDGNDTASILDTELPSEQQIEVLLSALRSNETSDQPESDEPEHSETEPESELETEAIDQFALVIADDEIREAFLDDAIRCLGQLEKCSLAYEQNENDAESLVQFCRELHTLKGASTSVDLRDLASNIHEIETLLQDSCERTAAETVDLLLSAVDQVRDAIEKLHTSEESNNPASAEETSDEDSGVAAEPALQSPAIVLPQTAAADDSLIRIRVSKLDRLMDMLAGLVVLRNRRENHISESSEFNDELSRCASRLSFCQESLYETTSRSTNSGTETLQEIARDISVVSNGIRDLQKPVGVDNLAISHFIRDFRQELMQLCRIPVEGLFSRLQRAARDTAKVEGKQLKVSFNGAESGLEQELQEKLFEPLMHVIRNAVSHGIESPSERLAAIKDASGTIKLTAQCNSQLFVIEICDDGRGLDYNAIRRRGIERGLLKSDELLSNDQLGKLIFQPGFSTCSEATQISGRGVGMDIVSSTVEKMRGRIDIESKAGTGTTMRLTIPLRSAIEHVMVFRSGGQLFALPTQAVTSATRDKKSAAATLATSFNSLLSMQSTDSLKNAEVLVLRGSANVTSSSNKEQTRLSVDEIVGPEEVVVRNLPGSLTNHPLFCGLTLSGAGETVLLLDSGALMAYIEQFKSLMGDSGETKSQSTTETQQSQKHVLVVDDSLSARKVLVNKLAQMGFETTEAGDGIEALDLLRHKKFELVLTDLDMPRLGGMEMLFDIQHRDKNKTPVVVVSSRSEEDFRQQALSRGAVDFLPKPVETARLIQVLNELKLTTVQPELEEAHHE